MFFSTLKPGLAALSGFFTETGILPAYRKIAMPKTDIREMTVGELHEAPVYGQNIRLRGKLTRFMGVNRYVFADDTGEIITRICPRVFGDTSLFKTSKIVIKGELKRTLSGLHIMRTRAIRVLYY